MSGVPKDYTNPIVNSIMQKHPNPKVAIPAAIILIAGLTLCAVLLTITQVPSILVSSPYKIFSKGPAVYYTVTTYPPEQPGLNSYELFRRTSEGNQIAIAALEDESRDFFPSFLVLPDESAVLVSFPDRIYNLNPHTGVMNLVYTSHHRVYNLVLSPDGSQVFIWDGGSDNYLFNNKYIALTYTPKTGKITTLGEGTYDAGIGFSPSNWVNDSLISFAQSGKDDFSTYYQYNPKTNALTNTGITLHSHSLANPTDSILAVEGPVADTASAVCTDPYSVAPSSYTVENASGITLGSFTIPQKQVLPLYFSPDSTQILLKVYDIASEYSKCNTPTNVEYYETNIAGTAMTKVANFNDKLAAWNIPIPTNLDTVYNSSSDQDTYQVIHGDQPFFSLNLGSTQSMAVIGFTK